MKVFSSHARFIQLAVLPFLLLLSGCQDPVVSDVLRQLESAKQTIEKAKQGGAITFAPELLNLAETELGIGEKELQTQENNFFWSQDFSLALRLANLAQLDAEKALSITEREKPLSRPSNVESPDTQSSEQNTVM